MFANERVLRAVSSVLRVGLGVFFLIVGGMKAVKLDQLAMDIQRFSLFPNGWEWYLACLGVAVELCIGVCFLTRKLYLGAATAGCVLTACFLGIFIQAWVRGLELSCSCLGVEREVTNYPFEVFWRLLLLGAMLVVWRDASRRGASWFKPVRLDFSEI